MPSNAELANQMSALVNSWQTYMDQQIALDNGDAAYVAPGPVGGVPQPGPGYYPVTMPNGVTVWRPCINRIIFDANSYGAPFADQAVSRTLTAADNGRVNIASNTGGSTNITRTVPAGLGAGFRSVFIFYNLTATAGGGMTFNAGAGATLDNDQGLFVMRGRYSVATILGRSTNGYVIQGSLKEAIT